MMDKNGVHSDHLSSLRQEQRWSARMHHQDNWERNAIWRGGKGIRAYGGRAAKLGRNYTKHNFTSALAVGQLPGPSSH
jgi:hypothetical protein